MTPIQLHVEHREQYRRTSVIAHQRHKIDQSASAEVPQGPSKGRGCNLPRAKDLTAEFDYDGIALVKAAQIAVILDNIDDVTGEPLAPSLGLMGCPFELAVEFACRNKNGQFANPTSQPASCRR